MGWVRVSLAPRISQVFIGPLGYGIGRRGWKSPRKAGPPVDRAKPRQAAQQQGGDGDVETGTRAGRLTPRPERCCPHRPRTLWRGSSCRAGSRAGNSPEGEAQGASEELAVLAGAESRRWAWLDLDAITGQGNAGEQGGAGGVIGIGGDPDALGSRSLAVLEPICQSPDYLIGVTPNFRRASRGNQLLGGQTQSRRASNAW